MRVAEASLGWKDDSLDRALDALAVELGEVFRGITVTAWKSVLERSPQYEGRMVVSWVYSADSPSYQDRSNQAPPRRTDNLPYRRGDRAAINIANALNSGNETLADNAFRFGATTIFISNGVDHGEGGYAGMSEYDSVKLRFVNQPGMPIALTAAMLQTRYGNGVSRAQAAQLRRLKI